MSNDVTYQPIDVDVVHDLVFPCISGMLEADRLFAKCHNREKAESILRPFGLARAARVEGRPYIDSQWGTCDPEEFLESHILSGVLQIFRELWPYWDIPVLTSIDLLPDDFPVLEYYEMPITLFEPLLNEYPFLQDQLPTIAHSERVGGLVRRQHVSVVRQAIVSEMRAMDGEDPDWHQARQSLADALAYAERNGLDFTEAIE